MGQLLNEMVSPHFYGLSIISNKVVGAWCGQLGRLLLSTFNGSALGACLAWRGYYLFVYNTFYIWCLT